ncbi:MAG: alpha/beta fold hydrolase [Pseudomonadota bacterium]
MANSATHSDGPDYVIFIPGMLCDERLFEGMTDGLQVAHHVASVSGAATIADIAERILAEAPPRFAVVGLSMGGIVAMHLWRIAPDRLSHMMLLNTTPDADAPGGGATALAHIAAQMAGGEGHSIVDTIHKLYLGSNASESDVLPELMISMAQSVGIEALGVQALALASRADSNELLPTISIPTTIVCGDQDKLCSEAGHQKMAAAIPGSWLVVIEGCGHMSAIEEPGVVADEMLALFAR